MLSWPAIAARVAAALIGCLASTVVLAGAEFQPEPASLAAAISLSTATPARAVVRHNLHIDRRTGAVQLGALDVRGAQLGLELFGGTARAAGSLMVNDNRTSDAVLSLSLARIDLAQAMRALALPRAGELQGRAGGSIALELHAGRFTRADVDLAIEPGTGRISRSLLAQVMGFTLRDDLLKNYNSTMDKTYGPASSMVPLEDLTIRGSLNAQVLALKIPILNGAMKSTLEPRIEAPLLWQAWDYAGAELRRAMHLRLMNLSTASGPPR